MHDYADLTRRLADLVVGFGANVQPGQVVGISTYTGKEELTREITRASYERGARWVDVVTFDPWVKRERLAHADESTLDFVPPWMIERLEWLSAEHAARVSLTGNASPDALDGIDPARSGKDVLPYLPNTGDVINRFTTNWTVAPCPTAGWAELVFPELEADEAYDRLWTQVAHVCRLDTDDPEAAWRERARTLETLAARLTERRFDAIRLHGPGTDVTVGLFPSSIWHAADFHTADGLRHFPNVPSEEIFTTPDPDRVDGHVTATRPLDVYGAMMDGIRVEFANGRATRIDAIAARTRFVRSPRRTTAHRGSASSPSSTARVGSGHSGRCSSRPCSTRTRRATSPSGTRMSWGSTDDADRKRVKSARSTSTS